MKPAADLIVDSAARHFLKRVANHLCHRFISLGGMDAKKQREHERVWKFRRLAEATIDAVVVRSERARGVGCEARLQVAAVGSVFGERAERLGQLLDVAGDFL